MIPDDMFTVVEQEYPEVDPPLYQIAVDGGGRQYILCSDMYLDRAEWLARVLNENDQRPGTWV